MYRTIWRPSTGSSLGEHALPLGRAWMGSVADMLVCRLPIPHDAQLRDSTRSSFC
jgi:hypothetical protein